MWTQRLKAAVKGTPVIDPVYRWAMRELSPTGRRNRHNRRVNALTFQVFDRVIRADTGCLDIGAYHGRILTEIVKRAPQGRIAAFEPIPERAEQLRRDFPGVAVHQVALADQRGRSDFIHVVSNPAFSGLKERNYRGPETLEQISVQVARLDDLVDFPVGLVKIDVEGGELGVFRGAKAVLAQRPTIVFEHGQAAASYGTATDELWSELAQHGLRTFTLESYLANGTPLSAAEMTDLVQSGVGMYVAAP